MTDLQILIHDEVQLIDWGESRATGPWVKLRLADIQQLEVFRGLDTATAKKTGHIFNMTLSQGDILSVEPDLGIQPGQIACVPESRYGAEAKALRLSSFFRAPDVWKSVGSDAEFHAWVQNQMCIVCGGQDFIEGTGEFMCEAAHVRRAGESGTAYKADYAQVPMCHAHHGIQHQNGELQIYRDFMFLKHNTSKHVTLDQAKDWLDKKRIETVQEWCWETLKTKLGAESWSQIMPVALYDWAVSNDVASYLPREYLTMED